MSKKRFIIQHAKLVCLWVANFADIYLREMRDGSMRSGTELAREIQVTDWSKSGNLSNRVQIPRVYLYSFWALFVLYEVQLDNNRNYRLCDESCLFPILTKMANGSDVHVMYATLKLPT